MTFAEKIALCVRMAGKHEIRFSNVPGRCNVLPGDGSGIEVSTKPWHVEWGYTTSDSLRWVELGIVGEGDTVEEALDDCLKRQAKRLAERANQHWKTAAEAMALAAECRSQASEWLEAFAGGDHV